MEYFGAALVAITVIGFTVFIYRKATESHKPTKNKTPPGYNETDRK